MLYHLNEMPEEGEIVLCKVTKLFPNSVFAELIEYGRTGMIHISEVSPGRIRNLRDYVKIGKQIVCKVLRIDNQRGYIDLSLRRVNSNQKKDKLEEVKQENMSENIIFNLSKKLKLNFKEVYSNIFGEVSKDYSHLYLCFKDVATGDFDLNKLGLEKNLTEELNEAIKDKFKPSKIEITAEVDLETYSSDGVDKIKKILVDIEKVAPSVNLFYLGAGRYKISIEEYDYKVAEGNFKKIQKIVDKFNDKISKATLIRG